MQLLVEAQLLELVVVRILHELEQVLKVVWVPEDLMKEEPLEV